MSKEVFEQQEVTELLDYAMDRYASTVILDRAIPDIRDGMKPVQRRILYSMHEAGNTHRSSYTKVTKIVGLVMGNYHPHGDSSIEEALVRMSQPWVQRVPLISIEGNKGSLDGDPAAAGRYIEARLEQEADLVLDGLDEDAVNFRPNYSNDNEEPFVLPADWPVAFVNGATGIAVGFSTDIASHNPLEMLDAAIYLNQQPNARLSTLMNRVPGPDFPTGGIIMGKEGIREIYETGQGRFAIRGRAEIDGDTIIITEIPYGVRKLDLVESIYDALDDADATHMVKDLRDESEGYGVRIVVDCESDTGAEAVLNLLYARSRLQINFNANHTLIVDGTPKQVGLKEYLEKFLEFKRLTTRRKFKHEWDQRSRRLHLVEGFIRLADIVEEVVVVIKESDGRAASRDALIKQFDFSQKQAESIVDMRLHRINAQDLAKLKEEKANIVERLEELALIAKDPEVFRQEIHDQLLETKRGFRDFERQSSIVDEEEIVSVDATDFIESRDVMVVARPHGFQRMTELVYNNNKDRAEEPIVKALKATTQQGVVFLTRQGFAIQRVVDEIEHESVRQNSEDVRRSVSTFKSDDDIVDMITFDIESDDEEDLIIVSLSKYGQVKLMRLKDALYSYNNKGYLSRAKVVNGLRLDNDEVVYTMVVPEDELDNTQIKLERDSGQGKSIVVTLSDFSIQGAAGSGVNGGRRLTREGDFMHYYDMDGKELVFDADKE